MWVIEVRLFYFIFSLPAKYFPIFHMFNGPRFTTAHGTVSWVGYPTVPIFEQPFYTSVNVHVVICSTPISLCEYWNRAPNIRQLTGVEQLWMGLLTRLSTKLHPSNNISSEIISLWNFTFALMMGTARRWKRNTT